MRLLKQLLALLILIFAINSSLWAAKYTETPTGYKLLSSDPTAESGFGFLYGKTDGDLYWLDFATGTPRNVLLGGSTLLNNLTDVTITTPSVNQVLTYDGSEWINQDAAGGVGKWTTAFSYFTDDVIWYEPELKFYVALSDHTSGTFTTDRDTNGYWSEVSSGKNDVISGFTSGAGAVADTDTIEEAIEKLDGNIAGKLSTVLTDGNIIVGNGSNVATGVAMSGEATIANTGAVTLDNDSVIGKTLTGYTAGAGTVDATDSVLGAIQKLDGNDAAQDELSELGDVTITAPAEGDILEYGGVNWENKQQFFSAGTICMPVITDNGDGSVGLSECEVSIRSSADHTGNLVERTVSANASISLTNGTTNYVYVDWNAGTPIYAVTTTASVINESNALPILRVYRGGTNLHYIEYSGLAKGLANKIHQRIDKTEPFKKESGLVLGVNASEGITISSGVAWHGATRQVLDAVEQNVTGTAFFLYNVAGVWTISTATTTYNNTQYDNGTNLATLTNNRYAVNWVFRGVEDQEHFYYVLGNGDYTLAEATASALPANLPELITSHTLLVGRIIVQKDATTGEIIEQVSTTTLTSGGAVEHNDTLNKQGGTTDEYYHLTATQHNEATTEIDPIYIKNGGAELALSGWSCSANVTITRNTTTPLEGSADFLLEVSSSAVAGNYCQYAFTATNADMITKMVTASIKAVQYNTAYNNGDIRVCVYDVTAAKCLRTDYFFDTSPKFSADFQIETNSSLALRFEVVTPSVARTLQLDGINVKSQAPSVTGLAGWKTYDISSYLTGDATITTINRALATPHKDLDGSWYMDVDIDVSVSSATRSFFNVNIAGMVASGIGSISGRTSGVTVFGALWGQSSVASLRVEHTSAETNRYWYGGRVTLTSKPTWAEDFSNVKLSSQTSNRFSTAQAAVANATAAVNLEDTPYTANAVTTNVGVSYNNTTKLFTIEEEGWYLVNNVMFINGTPTSAVNSYAGILIVVANNTGGLFSTSSASIRVDHSGADLSAQTFDGSASSVGYFKKGATIKGVTYLFNLTGATYSTGFKSTSLQVTKMNTGSQTIAKEAKVVEKWTATSGTFSTTPTTLTTFTSEKESTHGWFNTSTGVFTAERDGFVDASIKIRNSSTITYAVNDYIIISLYKNTSTLYDTFTYRVPITSYQSQHRTFSVEKIPVVKGDTLQFSLESSVSFTLSSNLYDNVQTFSME